MKAQQSDADLYNADSITIVKMARRESSNPRTSRPIRLSYLSRPLRLAAVVVKTMRMMPA